VIQIFTNSYIYDKEYKNYDSRKEYVEWKTELQSKSFVGKKVKINKNGYENRTGIIKNLVILIDNNYNSFEDFLQLKRLNKEYCNDIESSKKIYNKQSQKTQNLMLGNLGKHKLEIDIFKLRLDENIELFINWDYWKIGNPIRENFKIAELKENQPINIKIDGKRDFSMSKGKKRTFIENNYIIEYKGIINEIEISKDNETFAKKIPTNMKEINLMKYLK
jgi:hypothetical protein